MTSERLDTARRLQRDSGVVVATVLYRRDWRVTLLDRLDTRYGE